MLEVSNIELNLISISEIDEGRGIRFTVENKGKYKMDISLSIFKLKSENSVDDLLGGMKKALEEAEEALENAQQEYKQAKSTKDKAEKKLAKENVINCRRRKGRLLYRIDRILKAKKNGTRYIDKVLCLNIKRENAQDEVSELIESGDLMESDREIVGRLFHQAYSRANGIPDINVRFAREVRMFYKIIKNVHAGLEKLKLL
jgi:hypothetical protein